jgi:hypothetical protein
VIALDDKTRGSIEQRIEEEMSSFTEIYDAYWVFDTMPIASKKDFLLGFIVGKLTAIAWTYLKNGTDEDLKEVQKVINRWLPEIQTKITTMLNT